MLSNFILVFSILSLYVFAGPAFKTCMENGEWWRHPDTNMTWSNYTQCINLQDLEVSISVMKVVEFHIEVGES